MKQIKERDVSVGNGELKLPGTFTLPAGEGPFPAVVLVHGSGPQDRDETIGPNKPFKDLADGLSRRGIAVLRYEKRTKAYPLFFYANAKVITVKEETVEDAVAAVNVLRETPAIDRDRIFVLGHSLGGMLIPRIAGQLDGMAGFIILAGNTRQLEDLILEQVNYLSGYGTISEQQQRRLEAFAMQIKLVKSARLSVDTPPDSLPFGVAGKYWLDLRGYNPAEEAKKIDAPLLILQGGRDYQVTLEDYRGWVEKLKSSRNATFKLYPELNHLFMAGEGKSAPVEYQIPGHVDEQVMADIAAWIGAVGRK